MAAAARRGEAEGAAAAPQYNRDVRPIFSEKCFRCHGFDAGARKADLRLDVRESAVADHQGSFPIVPGKPDESELVRRIETDDREDLMPPPKSHLELTAAEKSVLRRWVAAGAKYQAHWSLAAPKAEPPPEVSGSPWGRNEIDRFVLARLQREGLRPAPPADKATLLRRVSLDLTGLPPSPETLRGYLSDASPGAYKRAVDGLLRSHSYGERMAVEWLDAARYADSNGYFDDRIRQAWPWRDWVINAFNANMPYDRFTIEQLAGDLLPNATLDQRIATGFNRNHMVNNETGIVDEEFRVEYVADRLETTATVWLGITMGCARCHDHKYDPFTQRDYYSLFSFFNNVPETGLVRADDPPPVMDVPSPDQRAEMERLVRARKQAEQSAAELAKALQAPMSEWEKTAPEQLPSPTRKLAVYFDFNGNIANHAEDKNHAVEEGTIIYAPGVLGEAGKFDGTQHAEIPADFPLEADQPWSLGMWLKPEGSVSCVLSKMEMDGRRRGFLLLWQKQHFFVKLVDRWGVSAIELRMKEQLRDGAWHHLIVSYDGSRRADGVQLFVDDKLMTPMVERDSLDGPITNREPWRIGQRDGSLGYYGMLDELRILREATNVKQAASWYWAEQVRSILATPESKRDPRQKALLLGYYVNHHSDDAARRIYAELLTARETEEQFRAKLPTALVMQELPEARKAHILARGQYDHPGEEVSADTPASLPRLPADAPRNRLGLARWIVAPENPLTARVEVNRLWQQCFGEGLVRTVNDFGVQGEPPTHPELLDWLAVRLIQSGWDVQAILRLIVTSATYQQASAGSVELLQRDPENRLLARGPRFRLSAEMIRDQALAVSGLLVDRVGGPSVKPFQPPGLWEAVSLNSEQSYEPDQDGNRWRRSLYTFWKRQSPPPALLTFDGPTREKCTMHRARTNTPLQALALLNDETYVEAARALAALAIADPGSDQKRLRETFTRVTARMPTEDEIAVLHGLLTTQRKHFAAHPGAAQRLMQTGVSDRGRSLEAIELAAWTLTAHAILNLDETIVRR